MSGCPCRTGEEVQKQRNDGDQQDQMDQCAGDMEYDETTKPDNEKKNSNQQKWSEFHKAPVLHINGIEGRLLVVLAEPAYVAERAANIRSSLENRKKGPLRVMEPPLAESGGAA
jgi:hypothetical protein